MEAVLEKVIRTGMRGEETEIAGGLSCEVDEEAREIVLRTERDLGIRVGDELESDAFEWRKAVKGIRTERTEDGFRILLRYG